MATETLEQLIEMLKLGHLKRTDRLLDLSRTLYLLMADTPQGFYRLTSDTVHAICIQCVGKLRDADTAVIYNAAALTTMLSHVSKLLRDVIEMMFAQMRSEFVIAVRPISTNREEVIQAALLLARQPLVSQIAGADMRTTLVAGGAWDGIMAAQVRGNRGMFFAMAAFVVHITRPGMMWQVSSLVAAMQFLCRAADAFECEAELLWLYKGVMLNGEISLRPVVISALNVFSTRQPAGMTTAVIDACFSLALAADEKMAATLFEVLAPVAGQRELVHRLTAGMAALVRQFATALPPACTGINGDKAAFAFWWLLVTKYINSTHSKSYGPLRERMMNLLVTVIQLRSKAVRHETSDKHVISCWTIMCYDPKCMQRFIQLMENESVTDPLLSIVQMTFEPTLRANASAKHQLHVLSTIRRVLSQSLSACKWEQLYKELPDLLVQADKYIARQTPMNLSAMRETLGQIRRLIACRARKRPHSCVPGYAIK